MEAPKPQATRPGVLSLNIKEKAALYASYMPFVKSGGIFIPTNKPYRLGDEVFMLLSLLDDPAKIAVSGHVVWITPQGAHNNHQQGIGVQFSSNEAGAQARNKIESLLGGYLQSNRTTHTM
ncbi:MAG TPA: PilZ domain-containing protein [Chitinolyticbacter sp.]|nr:PilZ domain-containing protein [Chitinolyticbacter sp.]